MTSAAEAISPPTPAPAAVTVMLLGHRVPSERALSDALTALPATATAWSISAGDALPALAELQIAVCDAELVTAAIKRWPAASTLALIAHCDESEAVLRAIADGATVCARAGETRVVAAFLRSLARRRESPIEQAAR